MKRLIQNLQQRLEHAEWHQDESGATMLEWTLLLAAIAVPSYWIIKLAIATLVAHYQMMTTVNSLPFP